MQLLPAEVEENSLVKGIAWQAPAVSIKDAPRFPYRGLMLDACRHFMPADFIKKQIDVMALFKINRLHWHLTDDQGWRIEVKQYPKLTEIGSKSNNSQGFYTQAQIKDIVKYAADRFITVIPEIEVPGHELAAISAYPWLSCSGKPTTPRLVWGVENDVLCAGKDSVFNFFENVFKEILPLFPSEYVHIGGDECPKTAWKSCPLCQARIRQLGIKATPEHTAEEQLQSYFVQRVQKMLAGMGKKIIGWDEILEGGLAPSATVMSWRGEKGGIAAAAMGHDVIMTPGSNGMYIDQYQGDPKIEPVTIGGYDPIQKVYAYDPVPDTLKAIGKGNYIMGVQCNMWTEYQYNTNLMEYRIYPRLLALAEIAWTQPDKKNYKDFERRLDNGLVRLDAHGINYHIPQPEQPYGSCNFVAFTDTVSLAFKTTRPVKMVYTLDGTEPTAKSAVYEQPIRFDKSGVLKIRSVLVSGKMSKVRSITVEKETLAPAKTPASTQPGLKMRLTRGEYMDVAQLANAKEWKDTTITALHEIAHQEPYSNSMRDFPQYSAIATGYVNIPADGVYYFSSNNEQVWIDGQLLIDNKGEVKRFSRHDKSVALAKGLHALKVVFLGNITGGWPSNWDSGNVEIRPADAHRFTPIRPDMLCH
jgi:hexosaminidase